MGESIKHIDHTEAVTLWMSARRLIFFCGSGLSQFSPAGLPTGWKLVKACIQSLERQFHEAGYPQMGLNDLAKIPLETLLGFAIEDTSDPKYKGVLSRISTYFRETTPNRLHFLISSLIHRRPDCHIITTNYDDGFEQALLLLRSWDDYSTPSSRVQVYGAQALDKVQLDGSNLIIKIHGCASLDRPEDLVLTTKQEASGLDPSLLPVLKGLFEESLVVFLGYSLSEPDCLEALMTVSNFNAMWVDRDAEAVRNNFRAQLILKEANDAYFLENLLPFIELPWKTISPSLSGYDLEQFDDKRLLTPFAPDRGQKEEAGALLFKELVTVSTREEILRILILCYSLLREFEKVEYFLELYSGLKNHSEYEYYLWKASIIRDRNTDWRRACEYFKVAAAASKTDLQKAEAQSMQFGLETLIHQGENAKLKVVEAKLEDLISRAEQHLKNCLPAMRLQWLSILGRTQKNLVQNLSYQRAVTPELLSRSLRASKSAIENLIEAKDIHGRIEVERFRARTYYQAYRVTKDQGCLNLALEGSERALRLFSLLGGSMGIINAKRQYAFLLIDAREYASARAEIRELAEMVRDTSDRLSRMKVIALESYFYFRTRALFPFLESSFNFLGAALTYSKSQAKWKNIRAALRWYWSWVRGFSG